MSHNTIGKARRDHPHHDEYVAKCIKVARLMDQGVDISGLRERFGVSRNQLTYLVTKGREFLAEQAGKEDVVQDTTGRTTAGTLST